MRTRLIVSPHLDDAALSVWHGMADGPVTVVTVFAGIPDPDQAVTAWDRAAGADNSAELMRQRRAEDVKALEANGAQAIHLDFLDCQYRNGPPPRQAIIYALEQLVPDYDEVWLPAGIGGHPDHRIVAEAAFAATVGQTRVMYADQPYALRDWSGVLASPLDDPAKAEAWTEAVLRTCSLAPPRVPIVRHLDELESMAKRATLAQYASQLPCLNKVFPGWWENPLFDQEWIWELPATKPETAPFLLLPTRPEKDPMREARSQQELFLSIIMRTQGTRPRLLSEALGSLAGQTDRDFELLVVAHDVAEAELAGVRDQLGKLPSWLIDHTRLLEAHGGTRSRPLNVGLEKAVGRYVAILDDDDLALPEWVEEFARLEGRRPGMVLRARVAHTFDSRENELFPESFDLIDHLVGNQSPICGLAYPRARLIAHGLSFDESLEVLEDWDFLLRTAPFFGVAVSPVVTSHYRDHGGGNSQSCHVASWEAATRTVIDKVDCRPILLPPGSVHTLRALKARLSALESDLAAARHAAVSDLAAARHAAVEAFLNSRSWRVTAPLRHLGGAARRLRLLTSRPSVALSAREEKVPDQLESGAEQPTVPLEYFENLYADNPDPWRYETEWYEERKYALTLASLPRKRYRRAFEPGCSIGVLTMALAARCDSLISADWVSTAVRQVRDRVRDMPWVEIQKMTVPHQWPAGTFDLIVISELARYLSDDDLKRLIDRTILSLEHDGHLVLVHHRPDGPVPQSAEAVHGAFAARNELFGLASYAQPEFLLDVLERAGDIHKIKRG